MATTARGATFTLRVGNVPVICTRKRVRSIRLRLAADGSVRMSIPWHCPLAVADAFLQAHEGWVREAAAHGSRQAVVDAGLGGTTRLWGETLPIDVVPSPNARSARASLVDGRVRAIVPQSMTSDTAALLEGLGKALDRLRKSEVERALPEVIASVEAEVGARASSWTVRKMRSRWGSCTPGKRSIRLSSLLAEYPRECLAYVATHECCHLLEPSHNARFHALMDAHYPGWRKTRALLNRR